MSNRLANKRCLIVGGTSGIGLASARRFLDEGASLVIAGKSPAEGLAAVASLPRAVFFRPCHAEDSAQVQALFQETEQLLGGLDVLFHVAGSSGRGLGDGPLHECTDDGWRQTLEKNLDTTFYTNRAAIRHFLAHKKPGAILNMASVLALSPSPHHFDTVAYTAAKGGIIALSRLAASRYAADGIRVNVLAPGLIDTPMASRACNDPAIAAFLASKQPLGHGPGRPADCSDAAVFLCSDEARFITGVVLPVDGGWCVSDGQYGEKGQ